jgi:CubicO group peptidase (beta-lactamase class C family)
VPATVDRTIAATARRAGEPGHRVPGFTAAIVTAEGVRVGAAGIRDLATGAPMTPDTRLLWFSMTKIATATAVLALRDADRLDLDRPAVDLVPALGRIPGAAAISVRHLLQHTAGLPNPVPVRWVHPTASPAAPADGFLEARLARVRRLRAAPGARAAYSNLGYLVLGAVVAGVTGRPFPESLRELVLVPLGMRATGFDLACARAPAATGHQRIPRGAGPLLRALLPDGVVGDRTGRFIAFRPFLVEGTAYGGLVGPADDAARLLRLHLEGGTLDGRRILSEASVSEMQRLDARSRARDHGLGWFRNASERGRRPPVIEHYGGGAGYQTLMRLEPERGTGVVVMGNSGAFGISDLADALLRAADRG